MSESSFVAAPFAELPILGQPPSPPVRPAANGSDPLRVLSESLVRLDESAALRHFALDSCDRPLKTTIGLCPVCLRHVAALVYSAAGRVWIRKLCPAHGPSVAVLENDERFYFLSDKDRWGRCFAPDRVLRWPTFAGGCCGEGSSCDPAAGDFDPVREFTEQVGNKSCTVLVEITNACNLKCRVCYSDAKGDRVLPFDEFRRQIETLVAAKGGLDSVQLTGGEAALHPQFWDILRFLHGHDGVRRIYLPTNGLLFARPGAVERLVPFRDKTMVLLQFDGRTPETNHELRNADPARIRQEVVERLAEHGIVLQLTMTLTKGVNDHEVGWVVDTAVRHRHVKVVALQPVTYSGRYELDCDPVDRLTLSDVVKAVAAQARLRMRDEDFVPIPCSHPNCGWLTLFVRRFGLHVNVARHVDLAAVTNQVANKTILSTSEIREMVGTPRRSAWSRLVGAVGRRLVRPTDLLGIAVKPFMDRFNYDQDRVSNCCHHLLDVQGDPVSFCEYNALLRETDSWEGRPRVEDVARAGRESSSLAVGGGSPVAGVSRRP